MKISNLLPQQLILSQLSNTTLNHLRSQVGQTIQLNITQVNGSQVQFQHQGHNLSAQTDLKLNPNSQLTVKVTQTNSGIQLLVQGDNKPQQLQIQQQILRTLLPNQQPLNQVLNQLIQPQNMQALPASVQSLLNNLLDQLMRPNQLRGQNLKEALLNSGQLLENHLKQGATKDLQKDIKAQLFHLQSQLAAEATRNQPSIARALSQVKQAIQGIQLNQWSQLNEAHNLSALLNLNNEYLIEQVELIFHQPNKHSRHWEVFFEAEVNENPLQGKIQMDEEDNFNILLHTPSENLEKSLKNNLKTLKKDFAESLMPITMLEFSNQPISKPVKRMQSGLINTKA